MLYEKVLEMGNVTFTNTSEYSHDEWLKLRTTGIGGSDAGAIMGLNKYTTPLSIYLAKKDLSRFGGNKATEWGNILEDPVRQKAREELGIEIETVPGMFTSKDYNFMNANFDGLVFIDGEKEIAGTVVSGLGGHEIKTSRNGDGFGDDEVPDSYYAQVQHYMAVTGLTFFVLSVFIIDKYEGRHYVIPRNDAFIADLINAEKDFWENNVLANQAPAPTGNENEFELIKGLPMPASIELDDDCAPLLEQREMLDMQIKNLTSELNSVKEQLLMRIYNATSDVSEDNTKVIATCGNWKMTVTTQVSHRVDTSALKKAGVFDNYSKESISKVLRFSKVAKV